MVKHSAGPRGGYRIKGVLLSRSTCCSVESVCWVVMSTVQLSHTIKCSICCSTVPFNWVNGVILLSRSIWCSTESFYWVVLSGVLLSHFIQSFYLLFCWVISLSCSVIVLSVSICCSTESFHCHSLELVYLSLNWVIQVIHYTESSDWVVLSLYYTDPICAQPQGS